MRKVAVVDVVFGGEEQWSRRLIPVFRRAAHDPDPTGHQLVGFLRARERGMVVRADENDRRPGAVRSVAGMRKAPAAEECVVGEELLAVVGRTSGEVDLDEQVEGELQRFAPELERKIGLDLGEVLSSRSMIACPSGTGISLSVIACRRWAAPTGGPGSGQSHSGVYASSRSRPPNGAVELDRPAERVQVMREPASVRLLDRLPFALR